MNNIIQLRNANLMMNAALKLSKQYRSEGVSDLGRVVEISIGSLPIESLDRLYRILKAA